MYLDPAILVKLLVREPDSDFYAGLVDGLVRRMRQELDGDVKVVATGGLADQMREVAQSIQHVNPNLRLEGLRMIWEQAHEGG